VKWLVKRESHIQGITAGSRTVFHDNGFVKMNRSARHSSGRTASLPLRCPAKIHLEAVPAGVFMLPKGILSLHIEAGFDFVTSGFDFVTSVVLYSSLHLTGGQAEFPFEHSGKILLVAKTARARFTPRVTYPAGSTRHHRSRQHSTVAYTWLGGRPNFSLNTVAKYFSLPKPTRRAISPTKPSRFRSMA
jgi:hypothetical protein